jgi:hypothetical protein
MLFCGLSKINTAVTCSCRGRQGSIQRFPRYYRKVFSDDENLTTSNVTHVITYHYWTENHLQVISLYINNSTNSNICKVFKYHLLVNLCLPYLTHCDNSSAHLLVPLIFQGIKKERERDLGVKLCWKQDGNWTAARTSWYTSSGFHNHLWRHVHFCIMTMPCCDWLVWYHFKEISNILLQGKVTTNLIHIFVLQEQLWGPPSLLFNAHQEGFLWE